jgi:hypothetical protein
MQENVHHGMTRIALGKIHAQVVHTSSKLQILFEHIREVPYLILTNEIKTQGNTRQ